MSILGRRAVVAALLCALTAPAALAGSGDASKRQYRVLVSGMT